MSLKIIKKSPLFYVGDKYKLIEQLLYFFPKEINNFYEPFTGGGSVFLNVKAKKYHLNDIDKSLVGIHKFLVKSSDNSMNFFNKIEKILEKYKLSKSFKKDIVPDTLKTKWKKTYYAKFNKQGYEKLKTLINENEKKDPLILYLLVIYGFNRMLRFNKKGEFNLPVGNVDFNKNVVNSLNNYFDFTKENKISFSSKDFREFIKENKYQKDDFIYFDPPYLITNSEYNKNWDKKSELDLLKLLDELDKKGVKFALSNLIYYKNKKNDILIEWMNKYKIHNIRSNYINYHNNGKKQIKEVLITNY
jgi:DNA adenine methylase